MKKFFLNTAAVAACALAFLVNVPMTGNANNGQSGLLSFGKAAKAECNVGSIPMGRCNGVGTRCFYYGNDCDPNS